MKRILWTIFDWTIFTIFVLLLVLITYGSASGWFMQW